MSRCFAQHLSGRALLLELPWASARPRPAVVPVFLPFQGCPRRCLFCRQDRQTGRKELPSSVSAVTEPLREARAMLTARAKAGLPPAQLAFYGGTFTALPREVLSHCLSFARVMRKSGLISTARCSTRPDAVTPALLDRLVQAGFACVELGVQSFAHAALARVRRGYDGACAHLACATVRAAGLRLGVQLMPGMPGVSPEIFLADVDQALAAGADFLRYYPCLVLAGTGLAALWRGGGYAPWALETTLWTLARGWRMAMQAGTPVIRMGLAPEASLAETVLAGPVHPALGSRVMGRALYLAVYEALKAGGVSPRPGADFVLELPHRLQGIFAGHRGELLPLWRTLGIAPCYGGGETLRLRR